MRSGLIGWIKQIAARPLFLYGLLAAVLFLMLVHNLASVPPGLSPAEYASKSHSLSISAIRSSAINAPHNMVAFSLHRLGLSWIMALRLSSAIWGAIFILCFYRVVKAWFGKSIGLFGTLMLAATPLFLVLARQGSAEIMYFSLSAIIAAYLWLRRSADKNVSFAVLLILSAIFLYTPGIIWWLGGSLVLARRKLAGSLSGVSPPVAAASILFSLLLVVPLGLAIASDRTIIKQLALIPPHMPSLLVGLKQIAWMGLAIFLKAPYHSSFIISRLPILNIVQTAVLVFGSYALWKAARLKMLILMSAIGLSILLAGIYNQISVLSLGLPSAALIICAGLRYLFIEWRSIFPRNPLARTLAYMLMSALVAIQLVFGVRYAFLAWPHTLDTKNTYMLK